MDLSSVDIKLLFKEVPFCLVPDCIHCKDMTKTLPTLWKVIGYSIYITVGIVPR